MDDEEDTYVHGRPTMDVRMYVCMSAGGSDTGWCYVTLVDL